MGQDQDQAPASIIEAKPINADREPLPWKRPWPDPIQIITITPRMILAVVGQPRSILEVV